MMANDNALNEYIAKTRAAGMNDEQIRNELKRVGWQEADIEPGLGQAPKSETSQTQTGNWKKYLVYSAAAIAGLAILGAGAWYAYSFFFQSPEKIWESSLANMSEIQSGHFAVSGAYTNIFELDFSGEGDFYKLGPSFDFSLALSDGSAEIRKINNQFFYKISDTDLLAITGEAITGGTANTANWIKTLDQGLSLPGLIAGLMSIDSALFIDKATLAGEQTFHYQTDVPDALSAAASPLLLENMEVWVGSDDRLFRQIAARGGLSENGGTFEVILVFSDYNKSVIIEEPVGAVDLSVLVSNSKALAEVMELRAALAEYFAAEGAYPNKLIDMVPRFLTALPQPYFLDEPQCAEVDPYFNYRPTQNVLSAENGPSYELKFCLTEETQQKKPGVHTADHERIN